ncbi:hypothetical protein E4U60_002404 [Claviceps pazoutovae]|uniref:Uncharacterized protein n=1 Tax=Claviceps pazoutovae TaxID=1649127 RepID=A0A9P7MBK9_9HYPO|nr:hypothetical protein E4U60_002404 [Claviceps pazoutovae]
MSASASEAHNSASSYERGLFSLTDYPEVKTQVQSEHGCMPSAVKPGTLEAERSATASYKLLTASNKGPESKPLITADSGGGDDIWQSITTVPSTENEDAEFISTLPELDELLLTAATATTSATNAFVGQATDYFTRSGTASSVSGNHDQYGLRPTLKEADLLLCYFDDMRFLQLPFASSREHRGWQFFLISRSAVCYWATLSLSAYGLRQDETYFHSRALEEMGGDQHATSNMASDGSDEQSLGYCFASLQLAILEARRGRPDVCRAHIVRAFSLCMLSWERRGLSIPSQNGQTTESSTPALCFIANSLRWCNAMWSCSMRQAPVLPDGDINLLLQMQTRRTDTEYLSQALCCQDWVVASIIEVVKLDVWKKGAAKTGTLSVVELVKRAHDIETYLKLRLQRAKEAFPWLYTERHLPSSLLHSTAPPVLTHYVTEVFATAALVYLHVVISGARRQVPDVHNHVRDVITLFRCRCCAQALSSLCWPLCLTGCLAEGEDRIFVLNLAISAAAETSGGVGSFDRAIYVIQECWKAADRCSDADVDWTWAMKSLCSQVVFL